MHISASVSIIIVLPLIHSHRFYLYVLAFRFLAYCQNVFFSMFLHMFLQWHHGMFHLYLKAVSPALIQTRERIKHFPFFILDGCRVSVSLLEKSSPCTVNNFFLGLVSIFFISLLEMLLFPFHTEVKKPPMY